MPWERASFFFPRNLHVFSSPGPIYSPFPKDHLSYLLMIYLIYFGICPPFFSSLPQLERWLSTFILFMGSALLFHSWFQFPGSGKFHYTHWTGICLDFCLTFSQPPYCQSCNTHSYLGSYSNSGRSLQEWELTTCQPTLNTQGTTESNR